MSIVCPVILVPTVRDFFFKLVLFTTLNSSQTAGLLLLCDHRIFSWSDLRLQRQPKGSSNLGIYTSTTTYFEDCSSLVSEHLPTQILIIVGNLLRWRVQYLYFVEKVGFPWSSWRRLDFVQTTRKGYPEYVLTISTATPEKLRRWHDTTSSRYSLVHS